jgi:hypothetical protein
MTLTAYLDLCPAAIHLSICFYRYGGELLQGSGFERETPEEASRETESAAQSFSDARSGFPQARYTQV